MPSRVAESRWCLPSLPLTWSRIRFPSGLRNPSIEATTGCADSIAVWTDNFDEFEFHPHEIREVGDRVLVLAETAGRIKGSGVPIDSRSAKSTPISVTA